MDVHTPETSSSFGRSVGLLVCAASALASGLALNQNAAWLFVFAPSVLIGLHLLAALLRPLGISAEPSRQRLVHSYTRGHPNDGVMNPATGLFITGAGMDASGNPFGVGQNTRK